MRSRLENELNNICDLMDELLDASSIRDVSARNDRYAMEGIFVLLPDRVWGEADDRQRRLQRTLLERWRPWREHLTLLFSEDTERRLKELAEAADKLEQWIQRSDRDFSIPRLIADAKAEFRSRAAPLVDALRSLGQGGALVVIPDSNVLLRSPNVASYANVVGTTNYLVCLVPSVLHELDEMKVNHRNEAVREKARSFSTRIKGWRNQGQLARGVRVQGEVFVRLEGRDPDFSNTLSWLKPDVVDDRIVASILEVQRRQPADVVVLLTGDVNLLAKADLARIPTADTPDPEL